MTQILHFFDKNYGSKILQNSKKKSINTVRVLSQRLYQGTFVKKKLCFKLGSKLTQMAPHI